MYIQRQFIFRISSRLISFKDKGNNLYNSKCPICGDSKNKNKSRFYIFLSKSKSKFFCKCHNCGYSNSFNNFLKDFDYSLWNEYKLENLKYNSSSKIIVEPDFKTNTNLNNINEEQQNDSSIFTNVDRIIFKGSCTFSRYLESRKIPEKYYSLFYGTSNINNITRYIEKYNDKIYQESDSLIIPYYNKDNKLTLIQTRYLDSKIKPRFQSFSILDDEQYIFNEHLVDYNKLVSITEGPIDSLFINNAVAIGGSNNKSRIDYIKSNALDIRLIFDNDYLINKHVLKQLNDYIKLGYKVVIFDSRFSGIKDINEAIIKERFTIESINEYLDSRTFQGLTANLELSKQLMRK